MNLFVTGATGFVGGHFVEAALNRGHHVIALKRPGRETRINLDQEPQWCTGDLRDDLSPLLVECDGVVHLAAAGVSANKDDWDYCFDVNLSQSLAFWRQAVGCGIKNFLICGSCFEYGLACKNHSFIPHDSELLPTDAYSASKAAASMAATGLACSFDLKLVIARLFHVYGEGEDATRFWPSLVQAATAGKDFPMTSGEQVRDFIYVKDAVLKLLDIVSEFEFLKENVSIQNVGSGFPRTLLSFAQEQWSALNAQGSLLPGRLSYRENEPMRCVPSVIS